MVMVPQFMELRGVVYVLSEYALKFTDVMTPLGGTSGLNDGVGVPPGEGTGVGLDLGVGVGVVVGVGVGVGDGVGVGRVEK